MLATTQAAPTMLTPHLHDLASLQQAFNRFDFWDGVRAGFIACAGVANLWGLVVISPHAFSGSSLLQTERMLPSLTAKEDEAGQEGMLAGLNGRSGWWCHEKPCHFSLEIIVYPMEGSMTESFQTKRDAFPPPSEEQKGKSMQETQKQQHIPVKIYRTDERLMVAAPMAGLEPEDIVVDVTADGHLVLHGDVRGLLKEVKQLLLDEWSVGAYHRELTLPIPVNATCANVTYGNGVLLVTLPISEQTHLAHLVLERLTPTHGEHKGNAGHPPACVQS